MILNNPPKQKSPYYTSGGLTKIKRKTEGVPGALLPEKL